MKTQLSGYKDVDREILNKLDDKSLLKACSIDKYTWNTVCDDDFLKRRLLGKYPEIERYKLKNETWKSFFLRATHYIALLKKNGVTIIRLEIFLNNLLYSIDIKIKKNIKIVYCGNLQKKEN